MDKNTKVKMNLNDSTICFFPLDVIVTVNNLGHYNHVVKIWNDDSIGWNIHDIGEIEMLQKCNVDHKSNKLK